MQSQNLGFSGKQAVVLRAASSTGCARKDLDPRRWNISRHLIGNLANDQKVARRRMRIRHRVHIQRLTPPTGLIRPLLTANERTLIDRGLGEMLPSKEDGIAFLKRVNFYGMIAKTHFETASIS